ncbi:hypothetical protein GW17_00019874 [Ensete ventricosum]|nr:hypothetical protein GW17_00019874 [Ensete ventricosum]
MAEKPHNILALEGGPDVARAFNTCQPRGRCPSRDAANFGGSPATPAFTPFGDANLPSHTLGRYWRLFNDPRLTPPPPNPGTPVVTPEAFQGLTNQVQAIVRLTPTPNASVCSLPNPDTLSSDSTDSLRAQLRLVNQRIDDVHKTLRTKDEHGESNLCGSPFIQEIQDAANPQHFRLPMLEAYDGSSDPMKHVVAFHAQMTLYGTSDAIMCRAFPTTLRGITRGWYDRLSPSSIHSFDQLTREFEANFLSSARPKPTTASLLEMRQKEDEHLGRYLAHFTEEIRAIPNTHLSLVIQAFMIGIRPSRLFWSHVEQPPTTVPEMLQRANQYIAAEILVVEKHEDQKCPRAEPSRGPPPGLPRKRTEKAEQTVPQPPNIPLNSTRTEIFLQIREKGLLKTPNPMKSQAEDRDRRCYYRFHRDYGHDTKCYDLKN